MTNKKNPLVCEYLENLSKADFVRYGPSIRRMIHRRHGVYALYKKDRLYYVGLATNLRSRIRHHGKDKHADKWDSLSVYLTIDYAHMRELESLLMRIASPKGNTQKGRFARATNLMRTLKADVRAEHRRVIASLGAKAKERVALKPKRPRKWEGGEPTLAPFVTKAFTLRSRKHGGKVHKARVLMSGVVRLGSRRFNSPSAAAMHLMGHHMNGLRFWTYERAPGQWVNLKELTRR